MRPTFYFIDAVKQCIITDEETLNQVLQTAKDNKHRIIWQRGYFLNEDILNIFTYGNNEEKETIGFAGLIAVLRQFN